MDMHYVFLSIGGAGTAIVLVLNLFAWLWLGKNAANPVGAGWSSAWLPNYLVWLSCLGLGAVFWLFAKKME